MLENDITDILDLTFTKEVDYFGRKELKELKPGGKELKVTEANKREYVNLVAQHHMTTAIRNQLDAFLGGFWDLIPKVRNLSKNWCNASSRSMNTLEFALCTSYLMLETKAANIVATYACFSE